MNQVWTYDIETLSNVFTYTALNRDTKEILQYVIWENRNDIYPLLVHLSECKGQIGFNNLNFDYPVIHYIIKNRETLINLNGDQIAKKIYKEAQKTIEKEFSAIKEADVFIPQLDLFRIWHFDNKARMTSLKKLEIAMNFPNVQDMPIHHSEAVTTEEQITDILSYNLNDVEATAQFYEKTKEKIELRKGLLEKYNLPCLNYPDSKIGEQLMLKLYCYYTKQDEDDIKKLRTRRRSFKFSECIPEYIKFTTPEFNGLLNYLKDIEVKELKESFKYSFEYNGFTFDLGTGGIHGCIKPGVYESISEKTIIVDADVSSLYPSLAITLNLYPEHLGEAFSQIYEEGIVKPRLEAKKKGDKVMADGFKLSANSVYGKSNSEFSFLYDPLYTLKTTLAGQLALCMLSEMLMTRIPDLQMLQINTDGLTVSIPDEHKYLYWEICKEWEEISKLVLEYVRYNKMIIRDVNNYIAVDKNDKIKYKGTFKPHTEMIKDGEYQKSFSQGIVAIAVSDYFLKGISVEETIKNHKNIYDFCKTFNASHGWISETVNYVPIQRTGKEVIDDLLSKGWVETSQDFYFPPNGSNMAGMKVFKDKIYNENIVVDVVPQQKNNRYYISTNGKTFRKSKDGKIIEIEAGGNLVTIFNNFEAKPFEEYNINYDYYINECYKILHTVDGTNERLEKEAKERREKERLQKEEDNYIKFCVDKIPTQLQYTQYWREHCALKHGEPKEIKPSKVKKEVIS